MSVAAETGQPRSTAGGRRTVRLRGRDGRREEAPVGVAFGRRPPPGRDPARSPSGHGVRPPRSRRAATGRRGRRAAGAPARPPRATRPRPVGSRQDVLSRRGEARASSWPCRRKRSSRPAGFAALPAEKASHLRPLGVSPIRRNSAGAGPRRAAPRTPRPRASRSGRAGSRWAPERGRSPSRG